MSKNNRLVYAWQRGVKAQPQNGGGRSRPLEATRDYLNPTAIQKAEWQSTVTPRLLLNAMGGYAGYVTDYDAGRSYARANAPSRQDLETGMLTGSHVQHQGKTRDRYQLETSASSSPGAVRGPARFQDGRLHLLGQDFRCLVEQRGQRWQLRIVLITDRINGVSGTPSGSGRTTRRSFRRTTRTSLRGISRIAGGPPTS